MSKDYKEIIKKMVLPPYVKEIIEGGAEIIIPDTKEHLFDLALGGKDNMTYDVNFDVNGKTIREAYITKCKNGLSVNFDFFICFFIKIEIIYPMIVNNIIIEV